MIQSEPSGTRSNRGEFRCRLSCEPGGFDSFYSNERREPPHIHVKAGEDEAKFWLDPVTLVANHGFNARELKEIEQLVEQHRAQLRESWDEYFG